MINHLLESLPYTDVKAQDPIELPTRPSSHGYIRPSVSISKYVPDHAAKVARKAQKKNKKKTTKKSAKNDQNTVVKE